MFKERPLQWIGEAEARKTLIQAMSETSIPPQADKADPEPSGRWSEWLRRWLGPNRSVESGC